MFIFQNHDKNSVALICED